MQRSTCKINKKKSRKSLERKQNKQVIGKENLGGQ